MAADDRSRAAVAALWDGFGPDDCEVLQVHSAFGGLSRQGVRAETFCDALIDRLAGRTLLMPAMSWRTVTPDNPVFDARTTPSHVGVLTEIFRTQFATHRSLHPTHSVAGCGPLAEYLLSMHHLGTTPCPGGSPYGLARDYETRILLLGVGLESCTACHYPEEMIAPDIYVRPIEEAEPYRLIDPQGRVHEHLTRRHRGVPRDFPRFEAILREEGVLREGRLGDTRWLSFTLRDLYRIILRALADNPSATLRAT